MATNTKTKTSTHTAPEQKIEKITNKDKVIIYFKHNACIIAFAIIASMGSRIFYQMFKYAGESMFAATKSSEILKLGFLASWIFMACVSLAALVVYLFMSTSDWDEALMIKLKKEKLSKKNFRI